MNRLVRAIDYWLLRMAGSTPAAPPVDKVVVVRETLPAKLICDNCVRDDHENCLYFAELPVLHVECACPHGASQLDRMEKRLLTVFNEQARSITDGEREVHDAIEQRLTRRLSALEGRVETMKRQQDRVLRGLGVKPPKRERKRKR